MQKTTLDEIKGLRAYVKKCHRREERDNACQYHNIRDDGSFECRATANRDCTRCDFFSLSHWTELVLAYRILLEKDKKIAMLEDYVVKLKNELFGEGDDGK